MAAINVEFNIEITDMVIQAIMHKCRSKALHWCHAVAEITPDELEFYNKVDVRTHKLTTGMLIPGIERYVRKATDKDILKFINHKLCIDPSRIDAQTADAIVQYSLFGNIMYRNSIKLEMDKKSVEYLEQYIGDIPGWLMHDICMYAADHNVTPEICAWYKDKEDFVSDWAAVGYSRHDALKLFKDNPNEFMTLPNDKGIVRFAI